MTQQLTAQMGAVSGLSTIVTPLLPLRWPEPGGGLTAFAYRLDMPPTGRRTRQVTGPTQQIVFDTLAALPVMTPLETASASLGTEDSGGFASEDFAERMTRAVDALAEVVAGCRSAESARTDLEAYSAWLSRYRLIARDVEQRVPAFVGWLRERR